MRGVRWWVLAVVLVGGHVLGAAAGPLGVSLGVVGGINVPVVQDDASTGSLLGIRARVNPIPWLGAEVGYQHSNLGDAELTVDGYAGTLEGGTLSTLYVAAFLSGAGGPVALRPFVGLADYRLKTGETSLEPSDLGFLGGLELGFGTAVGVEVQVGARLDVMRLDAGGSRKYATVYVGASYAVLP
jgi:hypothetical protein